MRRVLLLLALVAVAAGCGGDRGDDRPGGATRATTGPGAGRPPVRLATKNFTEQYVLGQLYAQALRARGFTVELKEDVGSSEIVDQALVGGAVDLYPEYTGVIVQELARRPGRLRGPEDTYRRAAAFEATRGFALLRRSPGSDVAASAVLPAFARRHRLRSTADLRRVGPFRYGGPSENRTRFQGAIGLRRAYGLDRLRWVTLPMTERLRALDRGRVDVTTVFTTEGQLARPGRYVVLADPERIYGVQNIVPVVSRRVLAAQGPAFARTLDAVTATLTDEALQRMNAGVDLEGRRPADVAREHLRGVRLP